MFDRQTTCQDAAFQVLLEENRPLSPEELMDLILKRGYWPAHIAGKTPVATLDAAVYREVRRGRSRFARIGKLITLAALQVLSSSELQTLNKRELDELDFRCLNITAYGQDPAMVRDANTLLAAVLTEGIRRA